MRLDKYLAHAGLGSRKQLKQQIRKQHVSVNGVICTKDDMHIDEEKDVIMLDDEVIQYEQTVYIMLHKPAGVISATEDGEHQTVLDIIDCIVPKDCFPVGRLDIDTEGLLLISNDGVLAHNLLSPKHHVDKIYYVEYEHELRIEDQNMLEDGVIVLDDKVVKKANVEVLSTTSCKMTISEGRYHQIKRMFQAVSNEVLYLKRLQMGSLQLDEQLACGEWRFLSDEEVTSLKEKTK